MSQIQLAGDGRKARLTTRRGLSTNARDALWGYFFIAPSLLMFLLFSL